MVKKYYLNEWLFFRKKLFPIFVILSLVFISMAYVYYDYYIYHPDRARNIVPSYGKTFHKGSSVRENEFVLIVRLFFKNLIFTLGATVSGFIPFLFLPAAAIVSLSVATGIVLSANELFLKLDQFSLFMSIAPHGIFEIPAIIYASSIGIYLTIQTSKMIIPKFRSKAPSHQIFCKEASRSYILIVVPLLMTAAFVEALVTPNLLPP